MRLFSACLCLASCWTGLNQLHAQNMENITGVLQKIDVKIGTVTIRSGKLGTDLEKTFSLSSPEVPVVAGSKHFRLTDLASGNLVHLHMTAQEEVDAIRVEFPRVRADLTATDVPQRTIRVLAEDLSSRMFNVASTTKIVHRGKELSLDELKVHQWLEVTASLDGKNALAIEAFMPGTANGRVSSGKLEGNIVLLDVKTGTLLYQTTKGREKLLSFAVPKDLSTWNMFDGRPLEMVSGPHPVVKQRATIYLSPDRTEVKRILLKAAPLRRRVTSVDVKMRRLIVDDNGAAATWDLPADIKIMKGQRRGTMEDLRANQFVDLVLSLDRTQVRAIVLANE